LRAASGAGTLEFMARSLEEIRQEIRALSTSDKEELLRSLWEELDGPPDPDVEAAWIEEVRRRDLELERGEVESIPAEEVFQRLRSTLKK
jgi:putative addiction module component (TIGR02574 family)